MLYLAEVINKKQQFIGFKADLKLVACQRNDQSWSAVSGEEIVPLSPEDANNLNQGQIVLVEVGGNKQLQRILPDTARTIVARLEAFSRQLEKSKKQEEEIEQWKQSLTFQSQELSRREMELEARLEQLQQVEEDFERLEQQRQEIESEREKTEKLREEFERNRLELEGAWEHLRGEQRRLEERQDEIKGSATLDDEQAEKIQELLRSLSGAIAPTEPVQAQLNLAVEAINNQQSALNERLQQLEQQRTTAQNLSTEIERQTQDLQTRSQAWHNTQSSLEQVEIELKVQQNILQFKQESLHTLNLQLRQKEELHEQIYALVTGSSSASLLQKVDLQTLESMPIGDLEATVQNLQQEREKMVLFVNSQEEELTDKHRGIEELQAKIEQATGFDRLNLETELAEEQDAYQFLNETLEGQRQNIREREEVLNLHLHILQRRQGLVENNSDSQQDLGPILSQIEAQKQQQEEEIQKLESEIEQMRSSIAQTQQMMTQQATDQEAKQKDLQSSEQKLQESKVTAAELWAKVNLYQETLQPMQEALNLLSSKLEAIANFFSQIEETGHSQQQALYEMHQALSPLIEKPQLALN